MLKNIFLDVKKKFETALGILRKEKITIDPNDPAAVSQYANVMKTIREKLVSSFCCLMYLCSCAYLFALVVLLVFICHNRINTRLLLLFFTNADY